jgi:hypothetical protein
LEVKNRDGALPLPFSWSARLLYGFGPTGLPASRATGTGSRKTSLHSQTGTELGEIFRQQFESDFRVIEDTQVTAYVDRVGQGLARHLPDTGMHFEFLLYDRPEIQAFSMPAAASIVSRKMIAFLKTEDELAGVLGHEMGHVAARQQVLELSRVFKDVLGLKSVSDTDDLFALYHQLTDSLRLKKRHAEPSGNDDKGQSIADLSVSERLNGEIGLYKMGDVKASVVTQLPVGKLGSLHPVVRQSRQHQEGFPTQSLERHQQKPCRCPSRRLARQEHESIGRNESGAKVWAESCHLGCQPVRVAPPTGIQNAVARRSACPGSTTKHQPQVSRVWVTYRRRTASRKHSSFVAGADSRPLRISSVP